LDLGLKKRDGIILQGSLSQNELAKYLAGSKLTVIPSKKEPFGIIVAEALCCGSPAVATNIGGIPEYINDDNGILFESGNPHDLANVIKKLIDDKSQLIKFTSNLGSQHTKHSIHRSALSLKSLYEIFLK
jgi:glycosyltransferase involved in cell wall biosynthesis